MSNRDTRTNTDRRDFLKVAAGAMGMRLLGVCLPPGALVLSGCTEERSPKEMIKRMIVAIDERVQTLDPAYQTMALDSYVICNIYDTLTWYNRELELVPRLALSWESPDNAYSWIFKLRPGVKFSDGTPCDAEAVKFHFDRIKDPATASQRRSKVLKMKSVEAVDPLTVRFEMTEPYSVWPVVLRDAFSGIVSPTAVRKFGNEAFTLHPTGSGPYMVAEQEQGERILLKRNPHYWRADEFSVPEVEFRVVREPTTRLILLEQGAIDLCSITFAHTEVAEKSAKVEIIKAPKLAVRYVGFNNMKPPFSNIRVRQAANMAINRNALVKYGFRDNADPLLGPLPTVMPNFNKNMKTYDFDPKAAKALLVEAGYPNGMDVVLWTKDDVDDTNLGVVVADQLRDIGIRVQILRYDRNVYWEKFDPYQTLDLQWFPEKDGVFDLFAGGWVGGEHPHGYLDPLFRSTSTSNSSFYKNDEVNRLLQESLATVDEAKRNEIYDRLQAIIVQDCPWIFAYSSRMLWGINPRIKNMHVHPAGEYEFQGVTMGGFDGRL